MTDRIRWGILGTGHIAHLFARDLVHAQDASLVAVGSRSGKTAGAFADEFDIPRRHASYEALAADPEVDVVYVATPNPFHKDNSILLLEHGKAVLCEKPLAINTEQAQAIIDTARTRDLFLMEGMWARFIPTVVRARELIAEGAIGEVRMVQADFGFRAPMDPEGRHFNRALGGGALMDVGIYPLSLASMVLGPHPEEIVSVAELGATGVDEQSAVLLKYAGGELAVLSCAVRTLTPVEVTVMGTDASIRLPHPFHYSAALTVTYGGNQNEVGDQERIELPVRGNGLHYEADEVGRCLRAGEKESDAMPLDETLALVHLMDRIRGQWGLRYPME